MKKKTLVLVGGGHSHIYLLKEFGLNPNSLLNIILVSEYKYQFYSGMSAAYLEGIYSKDEIRFDIEKICKVSKIKFIKNKVVEINANEKYIMLSDDKKIEFDIISVNTGSIMYGLDIKGVRDYASVIKPLENLESLREKFISGIDKRKNILVAGGGAAGFEIALSLKALSKKLNKVVEVTILDSNSEILSKSNKKIKKISKKLIRENKINFLANKKIKEVFKDCILTNEEEKIPYEYLLWALGSSSSNLYKKSNLKTDIKGFLQVNIFLQSNEYPFLFGAGDCISIDKYKNLKKVGVYAIKESKILYNNILKYLDGKELEEFVPKKEFLSIIYSANKTGILNYKNITFNGKIAFLIKNYIDVNFMKKYK
ncbi:NAD(P)/FAD-dependent oxidoreductase [Helicovermis profundi]|uniref:FAD-dependent oxidoreductase n=1 Tax=Helicovermis profundi TaxID=3065157 RepID=A0AAU9EGC3_9FIRM|nr:FAD-dependent oxidoreductase [Clostridia bacterium S502]